MEKHIKTIGILPTHNAPGAKKDYRRVLPSKRRPQF